MRTVGTPAESGRRRRPAVQRALEGYSAEEIADLLGADPRSVRRWLSPFRAGGCRGLDARPVPGRPPKLTHAQAKIVLRWLADSPTEHGFPTGLWTCPAPGAADRAGVGRRARPGVPEPLAAGARPQPAAAAPGPPRARRPPDRRLAGPRLAAHQKNARRQAHLALIDESGLLMAPPVRRSWAPVGRPPVPRQKADHREKVPVAAARCLPPARDRLGLLTRALVNGPFDGARVAGFLRHLLGALGGPVAVVWDGGTMRKGDPIREPPRELAGRLWLERLPPYGSEPMPVEQLWTWLKYDRLANFAARDVRELDAAPRAELAASKGGQERLKGFFHASKLPLPRTLLL